MDATTKKQTTQNTLFDARQVRDFVRSVKQEAGTGWCMLGPRIQQALLAESALRVLGSQGKGMIPSSEVQLLLQDMLVEAGLRERM